MRVNISMYALTFSVLLTVVKNLVALESWFLDFLMVTDCNLKLWDTIHSISVSCFC